MRGEFNVPIFMGSKQRDSWSKIGNECDNFRQQLDLLLLNQLWRRIRLLIRKFDMHYTAGRYLQQKEIEMERNFYLWKNYRLVPTRLHKLQFV